MGRITFLSLLFIYALNACNSPADGPRTISLSGEWEVGQSADTLPPERFPSVVPVPGLMDLAQPEFDSSGYPVSGRNYFWYRNRLESPPDTRGFACLKVHKAKFGHAVFINGKFAGKRPFSFTPSWFEISGHLRPDSTNEILIRVGAHPGVLPDTVPFGYDVEKSRYLPGLYDRVELFTGEYPFLKSIQVVPDIGAGQIRVEVCLVHGATAGNPRIRYRVREHASGRVVAEGIKTGPPEPGNVTDTLRWEVAIPGARLWSPEDPFLYDLTLRTDGDERTVRFGMREFRFDPATKRALLNGKPVYLRGTNIALHRFFEDRQRNGLPWDREWIERLHDTLRAMHWNSYRFHVGFAPEVWYEVADEKGFLVQDEYALWGSWSGSEKKRHRAHVLAEEYAAWMRERWNHPSVVIWDAQNETVTGETGKAIGMVRDLDRSGRPWDNGFSAPQAPGDVVESHPYIFSQPNQGTFAIRPPWRAGSSTEMPPLPEEGLLQHELGISPVTFNDPDTKDPSPGGEPYPQARIVNEYGWIWLYRNGTPAWAAERVWRYYPGYDTPEKRWDWRGRVVAAQTEYWRSRREIAGVQHFCILTCDRPEDPRSQVSDEWLDVERLVIQPGFKKYVKPAFSPVGIMIRGWHAHHPAGDTIRVPVVLVNDREEAWRGDVSLELLSGGVVTDRQEAPVTVEGYGKAERHFRIVVPGAGSVCEVIAGIRPEGEHVFSARRFVAVSQQTQEEPFTMKSASP